MQCPIPNSINIKMGISFMQAHLTSISFTLANSKEKHSEHRYNIRDMGKVDSKYLQLRRHTRDRNTMKLKERIEIKVDMCRRQIPLSLSFPRIYYGSLKLFQNSWQLSQYANNVELWTHMNPSPISVSQLYAWLFLIMKTRPDCMAS